MNYLGKRWFFGKFGQRGGNCRSARHPMENPADADGGSSAARSAALFERTNFVDLTRLTVDELALLEKLVAKAAGEFDGEISPPFRVEFVDRVVSVEPRD